MKRVRRELARRLHDTGTGILEKVYPVQGTASDATLQIALRPDSAARRSRQPSAASDSTFDMMVQANAAAADRPARDVSVRSEGDRARPEAPPAGRTKESAPSDPPRTQEAAETADVDAGRDGAKRPARGDATAVKTEADRPEAKNGNDASSEADDAASDIAILDAAQTALPVDRAAPLVAPPPPALDGAAPPSPSGEETAQRIAAHAPATEVADAAAPTPAANPPADPAATNSEDPTQTGEPPLQPPPAHAAARAKGATTNADSQNGRTESASVAVDAPPEPAPSAGSKPDPGHTASGHSERAPQHSQNTAPAPEPAAAQAPSQHAAASQTTPQVAALAPNAAVALAPAARATTPTDAVSIPGLAVEISTRARDGQRQFEIRLDPPELGRIDVRLHLDKDGGVTSHLIVDRPETLDLLRRDASTLEKALQSTGLKTDGGLEFSLRDQSFSGRNQSSQPPLPPEAVRTVIADETLPPVEVGIRNYGRLLGLGSGVDIRI